MFVYTEKTSLTDLSKNALYLSKNDHGMGAKVFIPSL